MARYTLTERRKMIPQCDDPLAQATKQHTGFYDLWDTKRPGVWGYRRIASSTNLSALRDTEVRLNTSGEQAVTTLGGLINKWDKEHNA